MWIDIAPDKSNYGIHLVFLSEMLVIIVDGDVMKLIVITQNTRRSCSWRSHAYKIGEILVDAH